MYTLPITLNSTYSIYIENDLLESEFFTSYFQKLNKKLVIITDSNLVDTFGKKLAYKLGCDLIFFPAGEINKTRETKQQLEDQLLSKRINHEVCLIALGGGVVTDIVGFLASTYCRGVPVIYIPTTLLSIVDATIGGKTGVNTQYGKNLIGTFNQPKDVFVDPQTLKSLPEREWLNGVVEMIKHGLVADSNLFKRLKTDSKKIKKQNMEFLLDIIITNCNIKKNIVEKDERDKNYRHVLNFGHTIGHAIEVLENYQISHGEAVAIGLAVECYLSVLCGLCKEHVLNEIIHILEMYQLPMRTIAFNNIEIFQQTLFLDKKSRNNNICFVQLTDIGQPYTDMQLYSFPVETKQINLCLDWARINFSC